MRCASWRLMSLGRLVAVEITGVKRMPFRCVMDRLSVWFGVVASLGSGFWKLDGGKN